MPRSIRWQLISLLTLAMPLLAQEKPLQLNLVLSHGNGTIAVAPGDGWKPVNLALYDDGVRPVLLLKNEATDIDLSYILFMNDVGAPTPEACRDAVIKPTLKRIADGSPAKDLKYSTEQSADGKTLAVASYLIPFMQISGGDKAPIQQRNIFGFYGDKQNCVEVHVSKASYKPSDEAALLAVVRTLHYRDTYTPTAQDYLTLGAIYFMQHTYAAAAVYYSSGLTALPHDSDSLNVRRYATDQLVMAYGMDGKLKMSRTTAENAVAADPAYPLNYYNLACADAEEGKADAAKAHLQQAFDRKANTLPGESLPDPTQDDSFLKLKKNKDFWNFLQHLRATR